MPSFHIKKFKKRLIFNDNQHSHHKMSFKLTDANGNTNKNRPNEVYYGSLKVGREFLVFSFVKQVVLEFTYREVVRVTTK
jgi:hypothetical protein